MSPGIYDWKTLGSSSIALADLRFGDFNGDGVTDVLKRNSVGLQVSLGGTTTWQPWNTYGGEVEQTLIADVDGFPGDDIVRYVRDSAISGRWATCAARLSSRLICATPLSQRVIASQAIYKARVLLPVQQPVEIG